MVYWHKPLFSSGPNGPNRDMREIWRVLYEFDADLVVNGHDHLYERFAPQDPDGRLDPHAVSGRSRSGRAAARSIRRHLRRQHRGHRHRLRSAAGSR